MQRVPRGAFGIAANVYISEGRNTALLELLRAAAGPSCLHVFVDAPYNRTGFTLASRDAATVHDAAMRLSTLALERLDLRAHAASHPRLGVVDHISVHALAAASTAAVSPAAAPSDASDEEGVAARALALRLGRSLSTLVPVYFYGAASPAQRPLDAVRRALNYFRPAAATVAEAGVKAGVEGVGHPVGREEGGRGPATPPSTVLEPDLFPARSDGPHAHHSDRPLEKSGVACVGALPWVVNYNLSLRWADGAAGGGHRADGGALLLAARRVAGVVSQRRGGPPGCQSMALEHADGAVEVACNLLTPLSPAPDVVRGLVEQAAAAEGLRIDKDYCTGLRAEDILAAI